MRRMTLRAEEFIRRFLLHVLPASFMRIRHYGILANRTKKEELRCCRKLLADEGERPRVVNKSSKELMEEVAGVDVWVCPECKVGRMIIISELPAELVKEVEREGYQGLRMDSS